MSAPRFCDWCDVVLDLHPYGEDREPEEAWECESANAKVALMNSFWRVVVGSVPQ